jgi:hypothetical protein
VSFFLRDARHEGRMRSRVEEEHHDRVGDVAYDTGEVPVVPSVTPVAPLPVPLGTEPVVEPSGDRGDGPRPTSSPTASAPASSASTSARERF